MDGEEIRRSRDFFPVPEEVLYLNKDSFHLVVALPYGQDSSDIWRSCSWGCCHTIRRSHTWGLYTVGLMPDAVTFCSVSVPKWLSGLGSANNPLEERVLCSFPECSSNITDGGIFVSKAKLWIWLSFEFTTLCETNPYVTFGLLMCKDLTALLWILVGKHTVANPFIVLGQFFISK